jgi:drug/metabolite transporter (DMT)-like permease
MTNPNTSAVSRLMVLAAAVLFSTGGAVVKATSIGGWEVACLRSAIAAVAIAALFPAARRGWNRSTWIVGGAYAATMICFVISNKLTTAANAIFLQATAPLYVLLLGPLLLGERTDRRQIAFMAPIATGMVFFFIGNQPAVATATDPLVGNLVAAGAGLSYGLLILGLRWIGRSSNDSGAAISAVCCGNLLAAAAAAPFALPIRGAAVVDWAAVVFLGVFQIALAYALLVRGVSRVPAFEASLILLAEPVLSPVWAWLVHGETPTIWALAGGIVILGATIAMTLSKSRQGPQS